MSFQENGKWDVDIPAHTKLPLAFQQLQGATPLLADDLLRHLVVLVLLPEKLDRTSLEKQAQDMLLKHLYDKKILTYKIEVDNDQEFAVPYLNLKAAMVAQPGNLVATEGKLVIHASALAIFAGQVKLHGNTISIHGEQWVKIGPGAMITAEGLLRISGAQIKAERGKNTAVLSRSTVEWESDPITLASLSKNVILDADLNIFLQGVSLHAAQNVELHATEGGVYITSLPLHSHKEKTDPNGVTLSVSKSTPTVGTIVRAGNKLIVTAPTGVIEITLPDFHAQKGVKMDARSTDISGASETILEQKEQHIVSRDDDGNRVSTHQRSSVRTSTPRPALISGGSGTVEFGGGRVALRGAHVTAQDIINRAREFIMAPLFASYALNQEASRTQTGSFLGFWDGSAHHTRTLHITTVAPTVLDARNSIRHLGTGPGTGSSVEDISSISRAGKLIEIRVNYLQKTAQNSISETETSEANGIAAPGLATPPVPSFTLPDGGDPLNQTGAALEQVASGMNLANAILKGLLEKNPSAFIGQCISPITWTDHHRKRTSHESWDQPALMQTDILRFADEPTVLLKGHQEVRRLEGKVKSLTFEALAHEVQQALEVLEERGSFNPFTLTLSMGEREAKEWRWRLAQSPSTLKATEVDFMVTGDLDVRGGSITLGTGTLDVLGTLYTGSVASQEEERKEESAWNIVLNFGVLVPSPMSALSSVFTAATTAAASAAQVAATAAADVLSASDLAMLGQSILGTGFGGSTHHLRRQYIMVGFGIHPGNTRISAGRQIDIRPDECTESEDSSNLLGSALRAAAGMGSVALAGIESARLLQHLSAPAEVPEAIESKAAAAQAVADEVAPSIEEVVTAPTERKRAAAGGSRPRHMIKLTSWAHAFVKDVEEASVKMSTADRQRLNKTIADVAKKQYRYYREKKFTERQALERTHADLNYIKGHFHEAATQSGDARYRDAKWGQLLIAGLIRFGALIREVPGQVRQRTKDATNKLLGRRDLPVKAAENAGTEMVRPTSGAKGFTGRKGAELRNAPFQKTRNPDTIIHGRRYAGHALDQMENRGLTPTLIEGAIKNGLKKPDPILGRIRHYDSANNLSVITEGESVVTVILGKRF